ncbi:enoyl-CoA hydratase/isomerase family protein [Streptomyces sp. NPDC051018]|uniref:enoyl-CoA hydratase/isomerase family protein n=1 Tax=Streptomyces sp. NPDC051018 TaxID=3365639 RepID=UPI00379EE466
MPEETQFIEVETRGRVSVVTLNRPEPRNAFNREMKKQFHDVLAALRWQKDCRVVVLTGAGSSFCSRADLARGIGDGPVDTFWSLRLSTSMIMLLRELPQPVVAAVRGHAVGGGFSIASAADLRIAAPDARFHAPFAKLGMSAGDVGLSYFLPRLIGPAAAAELFYTGGVLDAPRALELRYLNRIAEDPLKEALELAQRMAELSPMGIRQTKEMLNAGLGLGAFRDHLDLEMRTQVICSLTEDHAEAKAAFAQGQREPVFKDR